MSKFVCVMPETDLALHIYMLEADVISQQCVSGPEIRMLSTLQLVSPNVVRDWIEVSYSPVACSQIR